MNNGQICHHLKAAGRVALRGPGAHLIRAALLTAGFFAAADTAKGEASQFALRFHGTGAGQQDRVRIQVDDDMPGPNASAVCDVGSGSFTVEFWLRGLLTDNATFNGGGDVEAFDYRWIDGNIVVDRDIWGDSDADWGASIAGGFVRFGTGPGDPPGSTTHNTIEGNVNVLDGSWHHVALVRDASTGTNLIYVDGSLDFSGSPGVSTDDISYPDGGTPNPVTPWGPYIVLGAEKHDAGPAYPSFRGYFDELRIWNIALSAGAIHAMKNEVIHPATTGLVAYYRFEEGSGSNVFDSSAAGAPTGQLIAGLPGNGEWVARASDPLNTAPVCKPPCGPVFVPATSGRPMLCLSLALLAAGAALIARRMGETASRPALSRPATGRGMGDAGFEPATSSL